jgi:signal transduction histidine kinase
MEEAFQTRLATIQQAAEALSEHITRRKEAEEELRKSREELRALATRLQQVREEERASLARAIHDELSSALAALNMELSLLPSRVAQDLHQLLAQNTASMS